MVAATVEQVFTAAPKDLVEKRPAHPLNDRKVTLRDGAKAQGQGGKAFGSALVGVVWAVVDGKAVVHYGEMVRTAPNGRKSVDTVYGRALAAESDLVAVQS